ncbi:MAG: hypothetical protein RBQ97_06815 [Acholeplasma sp.]|nr:hypothetical protein [Acholeplasma sp.]
MKKIFIVTFVIACIFLMSGCGNKFEKKVLGTWEKEISTVIYGNTFSSIVTIDIQEDNICNYNLTLNNKEISDKTGTYNVEKNIIELTLDDGEQILDFEYDEENDVMYLMEDGEKTDTIYERK